MRLVLATDMTLAKPLLPKLSSRFVARQRFRVTAKVSTAEPEAVGPVLRDFFPPHAVLRTGDEFLAEATVQGENAKDLNRALLSALRRAEKRTRLRAEWTSDDGVTCRFFDYVLKKTIRP